ncbi:MAG TPA: tetratricopeptide repeat protein [Bryobacteraceae bacterium]
MPYPHLISPRSVCIFALSFATLALPAWSIPLKAFGGRSPTGSKPPAVVEQPNSPKAAAYYHFSLGEMYEELAEAYGNRSDYVKKAIDNYRLAMKEDPSTSFLVEDIAELYRISGHLEEAVEEAESALKTNPKNVDARRVLAHIYTEEIGDPQTNQINGNMARKAIEQYKLIAKQDPKDVDSLIMIGRIDRVINNSVDAEAAFKKVLAIDPDNPDAATGLASVYTDQGDPKAAANILEQLVKNSPSPRTLVLLATNYEQMQDYAKAADAYRKALQLDPSRAELKSGLAEDEARAGQFDAALKTYGELTKANPQDAEPYYGMSQIYRQQKNFAMAQKMIEKAKQLDPDNPDIQLNEVLILQDEGKTADAIAALKTLLDHTKKSSYTPSQREYRAKLLEQLGLLYRSNQQYDEAVGAFQQIAATDPDLTAHADAQIIDTYRVAKHFKQAQQVSDEAEKKFPDNRTLHEVRAQLFSDQGKTDQAIAEMKKLLNGKDDRQIYLAMADVYRQAKDYKNMGAVLDSAEKLSPTNKLKAGVLFVRGDMYEREKKYDQAEKSFRKLLAIDSKTDPTYASTLNYLGYMLADRGVRLEEAQRLIQEAVKLDPDNYAFLDSLGWVYYRLNRLPEAEHELARSVKLFSKDPTIHDHLGDVYFKQGKIQQAIAQWKSSLQDMTKANSADLEPNEKAKVEKKLETARVKLAQEQRPNQR